MEGTAIVRVKDGEGVKDALAHVASAAFDLPEEATFVEGSLAADASEAREIEVLDEAGDGDQYGP